MTSYKHNFLTNSVHVQYELHILGKKKEKTEREGRREGKREQKGGRKKMSILFWKQQNKYDLEMTSW